MQSPLPVPHFRSIDRLWQAFRKGSATLRAKYCRQMAGGCNEKMRVDASCFCGNWFDRKSRIRLIFQSQGERRLRPTHRPRQFLIFGPVVTSEATSAAPGRMLKLTVLPVEAPQQAIAVLRVAVRSAAITNGARGCLAFAICSMRQA
jgi:hypothetical protein